MKTTALPALRAPVASTRQEGASRALNALLVLLTWILMQPHLALCAWPDGIRLLQVKQFALSALLGR